MSLSKGKTPASSNGIIVYTKENLDNIIVQLQKEKVQLIAINEKLTNEKRIFEADKNWLFKEKNTLIDKYNKLKKQFATIQPNKELKVKLKKKSLKAKRLLSFNSIKKTF